MSGFEGTAPRLMVQALRCAIPVSVSHEAEST